MSTLQLSIIIPTCNRCQMLKDTLESLIVGCDGVENVVECLVVDNGSKDTTAEVVNAFIEHAPFAVRYIYAPCPGLHVGRNLGAQQAGADILSYLDDDIFVQSGWARAIIKRFQSDSSIALLGGPCLPHWESEPPEWIDEYMTPVLGGVVCGQLSLVDMGEEPQAISGDYVFGCNYSIRKNVLLNCGGFAPDGMPKELIRYRGSGESYVASQVNAATDMAVYYEPAAAILHRVPESRLTRTYFIGIAKRAGLSGAFATFRSASRRGRFALAKRTVRTFIIALRSGFFVCRNRTLSSKRVTVSHLTPEEFRYACWWYGAVHFLYLCFSPKLSRWARQATYFAEDPCPYYG